MSTYKITCPGCGRKFEGVADHASYVSNAGCAKIIEALAAS